MIARSRLIGIAFVIVSALLWSTAGLFVRMAELDVWTTVAWRSLFSFVVLGAFVLCRKHMSKRQRNSSFGWPGVVASTVSVIGAVTYIAALQWTTVANVMTIYALLPFIATLIAFLWLGERVTMRFIAASALACIGILITVGAAIGVGGLLGMLTALIMTTSFASQLVIARRYPSLDMTMATAFAAAVCVVIAVPFMKMGLPAPRQLLACALYGILTTGLGYVFALIGARLTSSGEAGFISMLDVVLGPLWVWIFYDESIGTATFVGSGVVILAVVWYLFGIGVRSRTMIETAPIN